MKPVLVLLLSCGVFGTAWGAEREKVRAAKKALAEAYVQLVLAPVPAGGPRGEVGPSYHNEKKALLALGEEGWEAVFTVFRKQRVHWALAEVLKEGDYVEADQRLAAMLRDENAANRDVVPRILRARQPKGLNEMLRPALVAKEAEVREAGLGALNPFQASNEAIELAVASLGDPETHVAFRAGEFLSRATAHVVLVDGKVSRSQEAWEKWWNENRKTDRLVMRKRALRRCVDLVGHESEEVRKKAGLLLVVYSGQAYYGFHNATKSWWGVEDREKAKTSWKAWFDLAWSESFADRQRTSWEHACQQEHPDTPLRFLRATIAMNLGDLDSESSSVRSLARSSIIRLIGEESPFQQGPSDRVNDSLNEGMKTWWAAHLKRLKP